MIITFFLTLMASATPWQSPPEEVLNVLHAPQAPMVWTAPSGEHLLMADRVTYPPLSEYAAGWHELAGLRIEPGIGHRHGTHGGTAPRIVTVDGGDSVALTLPDQAEVHSVAWTADGGRFALSVDHGTHMGLWVGTVQGELNELEGIHLNPMMGSMVRWLPDQQRLLIRQLPERPPLPAPPSTPMGPKVQEGSGDVARSTYESRNLLKTQYDDVLFEHYATSQLAIVVILHT